MADKLYPSLTKDTTEEFKRKLEAKSDFGTNLSKIKDIKARYDAFLYELKVSSNHHA